MPIKIQTNKELGLIRPGILFLVVLTTLFAWIWIFVNLVSLPTAVVGFLKFRNACIKVLQAYFWAGIIGFVAICIIYQNILKRCYWVCNYSACYILYQFHYTGCWYFMLHSSFCSFLSNRWDDWEIRGDKETRRGMLLIYIDNRIVFYWKNRSELIEHFLLREFETQSFFIKKQRECIRFSTWRSF